MRMTDSEHGASAADLLLVSLTRVEIWSEYRPRFLEIIALIIDECDDDARSDPMALEFKKVYVAIQVWLHKLDCENDNDNSRPILRPTISTREN